MDKFDRIYQRALKRKGGEEGLRDWLPTQDFSGSLAALGDDRILSEMTRCIFQAGFVYRVINQKWPGFEEAFWGFEPQKMLLISPEQLEDLGRDTRIVRNMQKILSVPKNAQMIVDVANSEGSFGAFVDNWSADDQVGLQEFFKANGNRLGGMTGQRVLRNLGWDSYVLTSDVIACLIEAGVEIKENPSSKRQLRAAQDAFNQWRDQSEFGYAEISRICSCSIGTNYEIERMRASSSGNSDQPI